MPADYLKFAEILARGAGEILRKEFPKEQRIQFKGEINIVTDADRLSEQWLIQRIVQDFPGHDIMTEESAGVNHGSRCRWIIDPLDGTTNYAHGYPVFCVSIALEIEGDVQCGAIFNPMTNEMFTAERGNGAFLNGSPLTVSSTEDLSRSLLATGFPYDIRESEENNINYFLAMIKKAQAIRRAGSAALDLACVAAGRFDGYWELKLKPWDTAAASLVVKEAGGRISDLFGNNYKLTSPHILASNGKIHERMIQVFSSAH